MTNFNESMERVLAQAREMEKSMADAVGRATEQLKPKIEENLRQAHEIQATLSKHAAETTQIASQQARTAMGHLTDFIRLGTEAMRESAEMTRQTATKMVDESRKVVEAASAAAGQRPGGGGSAATGSSQSSSPGTDPKAK